MVALSLGDDLPIKALNLNSHDSLKGVLVGKVIQFKAPARSKGPRTGAPRDRGRELDSEALRLMQVSDEIDAVILKHISAGTIDPRDLAGLMAHRLGTLMRHIDQKSKLWDVCEKVLKAQAAID